MSGSNGEGSTPTAAHLGAEQVPQHPLMDTSGVGSASCATRCKWQPVSRPTTWTCWYLRCQHGPGSETLTDSQTSTCRPRGCVLGSNCWQKQHNYFLTKPGLKRSRSPSSYLCFSGWVSPSKHETESQASMATLSCFVPKAFGLLTGPGHHGFCPCTLSTFYTSCESCWCSCTREREPRTRLISQQIPKPIRLSSNVYGASASNSTSRNKPTLWAPWRGQSTERDVH